MSSSLRICFIVNEYPVKGKVGGFGTLTRDLAKGLTARGWDICVLVPRHKEIAANIQKNIEFVDGIPIFTIPSNFKGKLENKAVYKLIDADIYHSEDVIYDSYFAAKWSKKGAKHIVTFQDPPTFEDLWMLETTRNEGHSKLKKFKWRIKFALRHMVFMKYIKRCDGFFSEAKFLIDKSKKMFNIKEKIGFLPNPVNIPKRKMKKARSPTVCFLGRWDTQKRPWLFFDLAKKFPKVIFIAMGQPQENVEWLKDFKKKYGNLKNLQMPGFVSESEKSKILEKSWALVSTSVREGLPVAFLEALAHETPIISFVNPDKLPEKFGFWAKTENFEDGLEWLLQSKEWRLKGKKGRKYVETWHAYDRVLEMHEKVYQEILSQH